MCRSRTDAVLVWALRGLSVASGVIVLFVAFFLAAEAVPVLWRVHFWRFLTDPRWNPSEHSYSLFPMLAGTLLVMIGSVCLATPLGILSAVFCQFYARPRLAGLYRRLIELLAGIPSVVYGFWGLVVLVPLINRIQPPGQSLLAGVVVLTIMILPTITLVTDASLASVPREYLQGAAALGLSRWATVRGVALPAARSGLITGVILQTGRAIGETMAVLMVCGNAARIPHSVFDPVRTLSANIALEMAYAMGDHRAALFVSGLLLLGLIFGLVAAAESINRGRLYA